MLLKKPFFITMLKISSLKDQHLFRFRYIFCKKKIVMSVVTFDQFNAALMNESTFSEKQWCINMVLLNSGVLIWYF